jgi:pimeloyl-ACP methyl ester carboxylesterase
LRTNDGAARDNVAWGGAWDIDPGDLDVPCWLWYGELDQMVRLSHGHWLAERIPGSTLVIRTGKGHGATIFGYWDDMLATLAGRVSRPAQG